MWYLFLDNDTYFFTIDTRNVKVNVLEESRTGREKTNLKFTTRALLFIYRINHTRNTKITEHFQIEKKP